MSPRHGAVVVGTVVLLVDQLTKWWAVTVLPGSPIVLIDGFVQFRYVRNPGAAFGFFADGGTIIAVIALVVVVGILVVVRRIDSWVEAAALGLVLGGAIGNLADRMFRGDGWLDGAVVDFIDFSFFPTFNIADAAITIGAVLAVSVAFVKR